MSEGNQDEPPISMFHSAQLAYLFNDVYYPFIIEHVKFDEIQSRVHCMREHAAEIHAIGKNHGGKAAAIRFMELLKRRPDDGNNYQELLEALKELEYDIVVKAIEKGEIKYQQEEHKKLVGLFWSRLETQVDAAELALLLLQKNVISSAQEQIIRKTAQQNPSMAVFQLIDDIPRKNDQWFKHFWEALYSLEKKELCQLLSPRWYEKMNAGEALDDDETSFDYYESQQMPILRNEAAIEVPEPGSQAGPRCECVAEIKNLQDQVDSLTSVVKANSDKLEEVLSILKNS